MKKILFVFLFLFGLLIVNGQIWSPVGNGIKGIINSFAIYNGELFIGGQLYYPGCTQPIVLVKWDGASFDTLPGTHYFGSSNIMDMAVYNNELYVTGYFSKYNHAKFNYIARWNGANWDSVGSGFNNWTDALGVYNGNLYIGGYMSMTGTTPVNGIAKWNGNQWSAVGNGMQGTSFVYALEEYNNELYVAGNFGINSSYAIARWNDTIWRDVGPLGINGVVNCLGKYNNELYAGGPYFTSAGGVAVNQIAKWSGTTWASTGNGTGNNTTDKIRSLQEYHNEIYVGGTFSKMDGDSMKCIARYNGSNWTSVGSGVDSMGVIRDTVFTFPSDTTLVYPISVINAMIEFNNDLYVGGTFNMIGGVNAINIAKWNDLVNVDRYSLTKQLSISPNPFSTTTQITLSQTYHTISLSVYDMQGKLVAQNQYADADKIQLNHNKLTNGMYFLKLIMDDKEIATGKIVVSD